MKIIDDKLMNDLAKEAKKSPRLRMNYNFHQSLQDKCHRFLNALEPGTSQKRLAWTGVPGAKRPFGVQGGTIRRA